MAAAAALAGLPLALVLLVAPSVQTDAEVEFTFADPEILESSGLVMTEELAVTVNDSGDSARIFTVDRQTGETVGVTRWSGEVVDVEALAPAGAGHVWVGDIGDNFKRRESITVTKVPFGRGDREVPGETFDLVYPDGARDAETLALDPQSGRLHVVSKDVLGGGVYRAPAELDPARPNQLEKVADAPALATDGAFSLDGSRLLVRNYGQLFVLDASGFDELARLRLPAQQQGEGLAVGPDGAVFLSSEGLESDVLRIDVPDDLSTTDDPTGSPSQEPAEESSDTPGADGSTPTPTDSETPTATADEPILWPWLVGTGVGIAIIVVLIRSLRPR